MSKRVNITYSESGEPLSVVMDGGVVVIGPPMPTNTKVNKQDPAGEVVPSWQEEVGKTALWVPWGVDNDLPRRVMCEVEKNGVASTALRLNVKTLYGQKVVPVRVTSLDPESGKETLEYAPDPDVMDFLRRSNINQFRAKCLMDWVYLGQTFPMLCLNEDRSKISMITHDKASKFRYSPFDPKLGRIDQCVRSANWPNPAMFQMEFIKAIDSYNWYLEVDRIRYDNQVKYVYPIKTMDIMRDYYATVHWLGIFTNGWLQNSNSIPQIKAAIIKNVMTIKYHITIPVTYWTSMYPTFQKMAQKDRDAIVTAEYTKMNDFLSGKDNTMKTFISTFSVDNTGKAQPGWSIIALDDKMKNDAWLPDATAANSEILFAIGVNPSIFGLNSPGGSNGGGANNGGSNIRESWLTMIAAAQLDRDLNYSWWDFVVEYNGYPKDIELRTIDKVLTTLDTGAGTAKTVS
jgi:hypothetical protein